MRSSLSREGGAERRAGGVRAAVAAASVALLLAAGASPCPASEIDGILRWFVTRTEERGLEGDGYGATLDVRWNRTVTQDLDYLLSVRLSTDSEEELLTLAPLESTRNEIEPRFQLDYTPGPFELSVGQRWLQVRDRTDGFPSTVRDENNLFGRFATQSETWPRLELEYDRRDVSTDESADVTNWRLAGSVGMTRSSWSASVGHRRSVNDTEGSLRREVDENLASVSFNRLVSDGRLAMFANYNLNDLDGRDRLDRETLVPIPRALRQGLLVRDEAPLDGALAPAPALIDGDRAGATAANIGGGLAGGQTDWNLGVELALNEFVDGVDVWLSTPIPSENAQRYRWEVYRSEDNLTWIQVTGAAARRYDPFDGRFRLTFAPVTARYVKVVNASVDDALGAVFVSELEVFGQELRSGTTRNETRTENAAATLSWNPGTRFSATVGGFGSRIRNRSGDQRTMSEDTSGNVTLNLRPVQVFQASLSALSSRRQRSAVATESEQTYSATLTLLPVPDLDLTLLASHRQRERGALRGDTDSMLLRAASLLYRDLSVSLEFGETDEEAFDAPARTRETLRATLDARPREQVELSSSLLSERLETPSLAPGDRVQDIVSWNNRLTIRPSSVLSLTLQGTRFDLPDREGWSRVVQFDWLPFAGGALQFSLDYREDVPLGGAERKVESARLRWNLNRQMFLDLDATRQTQDMLASGRETRTIYTAFFQARL